MTIPTSGPKPNLIKQVLASAIITFGLMVSSAANGDNQNSSEPGNETKLDQLAIVAEHQQFVDRTVENFLDGINQGFEDVEQAGHIEQDYVDLARQVALNVYTSDRVLASVHAHLQRQLNPSDYAPLIALHRSDIRHRERAAEESARIRLETPEGTDIFEAYVKTYRASSQFVERSELINDLHETLKISELMAQLLIDTQTANVIGLSYTQPQESRANLDDVIANIRAQQPTIEKLLQAQFAHHQAYIYRGFSTEEIETLTMMYSTDEYKRYFGAVMQGLRVGLTKMSIEFGDKLGSAMVLAESSQAL